MLLHELVDDFEAGSIDTGRWPGNYGGTAQAGGRAQVDCAAAVFSGWKSGAAYTLTGSMCGGRFYPPAAAGATTTAYMAILVTTTTPGTDAGWNIDVQSGFMGLLLREGFSDGAAVFLAYSPTDHAWLRVREEAGSLLWEASPDGDAWTTLRTAAAPAWASDTDLALLIECKRQDGTDNVGEFDNVNLFTPRTGTVNVDLVLAPAAAGRKQATGTTGPGLGLAPAAAGRSVRSGAAATGVQLALAVAGRKVGTGTVDVSLSLAPAGGGRSVRSGTAALTAALRLTVTAAARIVPGTLTPGGTAAALTAAGTAATLTAAGTP